MFLPDRQVNIALLITPFEMVSWKCKDFDVSYWILFLSPIQLNALNWNFWLLILLLEVSSSIHHIVHIFYWAHWQLSDATCKIIYYLWYTLLCEAGNGFRRPSHQSRRWGASARDTSVCRRTRPLRTTGPGTPARGGISPGYRGPEGQVPGNREKWEEMLLLWIGVHLQKSHSRMRIGNRI